MTSPFRLDLDRNPRLSSWYTEGYDPDYRSHSFRAICTLVLRLGELGCRSKYRCEIAGYVVDLGWILEEKTESGNAFGK